MSWDYENRVTAISDGGAYYYNGDGRRIAKDENGISTYYFFNDYEEEHKAGVKSKIVKYYFANNQRVAENSSIDGVRYYIQDHLGSTAAVTDAAGSLVLRTNYAPYGEIATTQGDGGVKYTFTGKEQDKTGLYYFGARFYDPEVGRFISVDPAKQGLNWYSYCDNNPLKYVDPTGMYYEATRTWGATGWVFCVGDGPAPFGDAIYAGGEAIAFVGDTLYYFGDKIVSGINNFMKNADTVKNGAETGNKGSQSNNSNKSNNNNNNRNSNNNSNKPQNQGFKNQVEKMSDKSLQKTINSLENRITEHQNKIQTDPTNRAAQHWEHEIRVWKQQLEIASTELGSR